MKFFEVNLHAFCKVVHFINEKNPFVMKWPSLLKRLI
jgi:hypothetical protein